MYMYVSIMAATKDVVTSPEEESVVPPEVVKKTRAVLLSCTKGVLLKSFGKDYYRLAGMFRLR